MARGSILSRSKAEVGFNMTPMIDCTFQLIIFFMLSTQMASQDYAKMELPKPTGSVAKDLVTDLVINIVPHPRDKAGGDTSRDGLALEYRIRGARIKLNDTAKVVALLKRERGYLLREKRKEFAVEVRADKSLHYDQIQPILSSLQEAKIDNMHLTAILGGGRRAE